MTSSTINRYLLIVELKNDSTIKRIATDVPKIIDFIRGFSKGEHEQAFRSKDGLLFGYFFKASHAPGNAMRAEFEKCGGTINGDSMMVVEVRDLVTGLGFSRAWTWLQRH